MYTYHNISLAKEYHQSPLGFASRPPHLFLIPPCEHAPQCNKVVWVEKKLMKIFIRCKLMIPTTISLSRKAFELCRLLHVNKFDHKHTLVTLDVCSLFSKYVAHLSLLEEVPPTLQLCKVNQKSTLDDMICLSNLHPSYFPK
jgi:hypothetical protein